MGMIVFLALRIVHMQVKPAGADVNKPHANAVLLSVFTDKKHGNRHTLQYPIRVCYPCSFQQLRQFSRAALSVRTFHDDAHGFFDGD